MSTKTFHGDAPDVVDTWTLTPANVGVGNTFTVTINGKSITVTATDTTVANVTALLAAALNANADDILEFAELKAVDNTTLVTVTVRDAGVPTVISSSAAGGTATLTAANTQAASGSHFIDTAVNFAGDVAAVAADDLVLSNGCSDVLYGLDQSGIGLSSLIVKEGAGLVGLPKLHPASGRSYDEFRDEYLAWDSITTLEILTRGSRCKIDPGAVAACAALINSTGIRLDEDVPAILLLGSHASNSLTILRGDVGVAFYEGESANWPTINVGYVEDILGDVDLFIGDGASTITALNQNGGEIDCEAAVTTLSMVNGIFRARAGAIGTADVDGGTFIELGQGTITTLHVGNEGVADFSQDVRAVTVTNCELHAGGTIYDPLRRVTFTNGIDLVRCGLHDVDLRIGEHVTISLSDI